MPFANNNGVNIHYEVEGKGPPILFQHGFTNTLNTWRNYGYVEALSKDYQCILLDARGHGQSDKPHDSKAYYWRNMVLDQVAVLDDLKIQRVHYWGYSMGAGIGYRIPIYAPDRFYSLILSATDSAPGMVSSSDLSPAFEALKQAVQEGGDNPMEVYLSFTEKTFGVGTPERKASILAQDAKALLALNLARREEPRLDFTGYLAGFSLPCLIYGGDADPRIAGAREAAKQIPGAKFFSLPGLNHLQAYAASDLVVPHVKEFLESVKNVK